MDSLFEKTDLKEALVALGFSEKEIQVLIFLLNAGKAPASTIALRTRMKRSSCYLVLSSLVQKNFLVKTTHDGIQAIPGFKFLYSFPLKTKKRIYGTGMISFNTQDQFIAKKVAFEKIMDRVAECIELRLAMQKLESRSLELTDLDILNSTLKKLPVEMMSEEPWNEITALKMQEVRRFKLLQ